MASQSKRAQSYTQSGSGNEWYYLANLTDTSSSTEAYASTNPSTQTIELYNFGFSIPSGSTIVGVVVEVKGRREISGTPTLYVTLQVGSTTSRTKSTSVSSGTITTFTFGGPSDLWGLNPPPTRSDINSSSFKVLVRASGGSSTTNIRLGDLVTYVYYETTTSTSISKSDSGTVTGSESISAFERSPEDQGLLLSSENLVPGIRIDTSDSEFPLLSSDDIFELSRDLLDSGTAVALESSGLEAYPSSLDSGALLSFEAAGRPVEDTDEWVLVAPEGSLLWVEAPTTDESSVSGLEDWGLEAQTTVSDPILLPSIEEPDIQAFSESSDSGLFFLGAESQDLILDLLDPAVLSDIEESFNLLELLEDLILEYDDSVGNLLRILDPRAWIEISYPKAILDVYEQGRKIVERVFRGTETSVFLRFSSTAGRYYDPLSVRLLVRKPSGSLSLVPLTRMGSGIYRATVLFDEPGIWVLRGEGEDPLLAVTEERIEVIGDL